MLKSLDVFVKEQRIGAARISPAIGHFSQVVLKHFDRESKQYLDNNINEQVEVASLIGDVVAAPSGDPAIHIHVVVGKRDGSAMAGHLAAARVWLTLLNRADGKSGAFGVQIVPEQYDGCGDKKKKKKKKKKKIARCYQKVQQEAR